MAEPLSVTASVLTIAIRCVTTAHDLNRAFGNYQHATETLDSIRDEIGTITDVLEPIREALAAHSRILETRGLTDRFTTTLDSCRDVVAQINAEFERLTSGREWWTRVKVLWNEADMLRLLSLLQRRQNALSWLLRALDLHATNTLSRQVHETIAQPLRPLYLSSRNPAWEDASAAGSTVGVFGSKETLLSITEFDFDREIALEGPYMRARSAAVHDDTHLTRQSAEPVLESIKETEEVSLPFAHDAQPGLRYGRSPSNSTSSRPIQASILQSSPEARLRERTPVVEDESVAHTRDDAEGGGKFVYHARAMYQYKAQIPEELSFSKGDILKVLRVQDDGWWEAQVLGKNDGPGLAPSNYLQIQPTTSVTEKDLVAPEPPSTSQAQEASLGHDEPPLGFPEAHAAQPPFPNNPLPTHESPPINIRDPSHTSNTKNTPSAMGLGLDLSLSSTQPPIDPKSKGRSQEDRSSPRKSASVQATRTRSRLNRMNGQTVTGLIDYLRPGAIRTRKDNMILKDLEDFTAVFVKSYDELAKAIAVASRKTTPKDLSSLNLASIKIPGQSREAESTNSQGKTSTVLPPGTTPKSGRKRSSTGNPSSSLNNPALLQTVEDAIRRLILPELEREKAQSRKEDALQKARAPEQQTSTIVEGAEYPPPVPKAETVIKDESEAAIPPSPVKDTARDNESDDADSSIARERLPLGDITNVQASNPREHDKSSTKITAATKAGAAPNEVKKYSSTTKKSQNSLLIEYFENGASSSSRPRRRPVRVRVTPSSSRPLPYPNFSRQHAAKVLPGANNV